MSKITNTGKILRAVRYYYNFTQVKFAEKLGVTQGTLSKIEANQLELSANQWVEFCIAFNLDPYSLVTGVIQTLPRPEEKGSLRIPKIYVETESATVRYVYPLIKLMKETLGEDYYHDFLKKNKLNDDYFCILVNPINTNLFQLFFAELNKKGKLNYNAFSELLDILKFDEVYPTGVSMNSELTLAEKYQHTFSMFKNYFDHGVDFNLSNRKKPIVFIGSDKNKEVNNCNKFKLDYIAAFVNNLEDQFDGKHWQFEVVNSDDGWGLYRAA